MRYLFNVTYVYDLPQPISPRRAVVGPLQRSRVDPGGPL
jgi:hypothetical protein